MKAKNNPSTDYFDAFYGEPTSSWLYVNWESLSVPQYRWKPRLAISLPLMRSPPHGMNQCYDKIPLFYKNAIFFVDPSTRQTYPDAPVQNCPDRIKNIFQFDMEDEKSWFTITTTLVQRK